jgi:class 3 adenylate cyclase
LADHISDTKLVELPGADNWSVVGDTAALLGEVQEFLTGTRSAPELSRVLATVLFTDIVASTDRVAEVGDREWRRLLDRHDELVDQQLERFRGRLIKTTGDGVLATFDGPAIAIRCAEAIAQRANAIGLQVRAGIHTGEVEQRGDDIAGIAVHVAQRICATAEGDQIVVSRTVVDLTAGSDIRYDDKGQHQLKGVPGAWPLFAVAS